MIINRAKDKNRKLKIAIVTEDFLPFYGGQEVRYLELAEKLSEYGSSVDIFTMRVYPQTEPEERFGLVNVYRITNALRYKNSIWGRRNPIDIIRFTFSIFRKRRELSGYDIVLFNIWPLLPPLLIPFFLNTVSVVDWCEIRRSFLWNIVYKLLARKGLFHIGVSKDICEQLVDHYSIDPKGVMPILSGVDFCGLNSAVRNKSRGMLLFMSRFTQHKDPEIVLEAFRYGGLFDRGYNLHLVGHGELYDGLKNKYLLEKGVVFHGSVSDRDKAVLLSEAMVLILPSRREGFPRVIAEASATGTPTITTNDLGNGGADVVSEYGIGWVCSHSPQDISRTILEHISLDNKEWMAVSENCIAVAKEKFSWDRVANDFLGFISRIGSFGDA
ncbi:MAG TPA: glycosyltransferase family 4 protein [Candidatus Acidoferrales bacterium]|nr:glycosyltransferase family 4 protein [Candidatus Acidoferrales bacterium]